ncbi:MAG TPA: DUF2461 domain-containing protein [Vicinamibacterales bacterium]|jgi:uncharacterized protein (TIGR02453 family)
MNTARLPAPRFTPRTLSFLRSLKRHNDRAWFAEHRDAYERDVRGPMTALVEQLAIDLPRYSPELAASPRSSLYRIYRDTRFSGDKSPFKTQVGAIFPHRDLPRHRGAGLYLEIGPAHTMIAGGIYAPETSDLHALRQHIADNHRRFRALVDSPGFLRAVGPVNGDALKRVPRGFPADHAAAEYLKLRQFLFGRTYPAAFALGPRFYQQVLALFERMAPVIRFLNEPLVAQLALRDPLITR